MFVKVEDGTPAEYAVTDITIRARHPNISFPKSVAHAIYNSLGYFYVVPSMRPAALPGQIVEETAPVVIDGTWHQQWAMRNATGAETSAKAAEVRGIRNRLLSESDWTQVADSPAPKDLWATYRQQLREVSTQPGFPWEVVWPSYPTE